MKTSYNKKPGITASRQVADNLPEVLINYLCILVKTDREVVGSRHVFKLCKAWLSGREIQDIFHIGENAAYTSHRVFGYKPVEAEITIICDETGYQLTADGMPISAPMTAA